MTDVRAQFPQLDRMVRDRPLVYLDSAATTLKPRAVIDAVSAHLSQGVANVHRGAHWLSDDATERFEAVREQARRFMNASTKNEIIFTRGTTDGLNLLAHSLGRITLNAGDEIVLSQMEHHSNIVPWQMIARERGARVRFAPVRDDGTIDADGFRALLSPRTKIVSLVHLSNALGTVNPLADLFTAARAVGAACVADCAQSASLGALDVTALGCDFLVFSGHKMFGPTGVGVLWGKYEWLERMPPYQGGGSMIADVFEEDTTYLAPPHRFEAGTPSIAEVLGLGAAFDFVTACGPEALARHEALDLAVAELRKIDGVRLIGTPPDRRHVVSFLLEGAHPSDVGAILDEQGVAVRAGHHCCQPLMRRFGIPGTVRASFGVYNSTEDVGRFITALKKAKEMLT